MYEFVVGLKGSIGTVSCSFGKGFSSTAALGYMHFLWGFCSLFRSFLWLLWK